MSDELDARVRALEADFLSRTGGESPDLRNCRKILGYPQAYTPPVHDLWILCPHTVHRSVHRSVRALPTPRCTLEER